jgi:hypothetical protein
MDVDAIVNQLRCVRRLSLAPLRAAVVTLERRGAAAGMHCSEAGTDGREEDAESATPRRVPRVAAVMLPLG